MKILESTHVLIGLGLNGIQVLEKLLSSGVTADSITVVDPNEFGAQKQSEGQKISRSTLDSYKRNRVNSGISKGGVPIGELREHQKSQTYSWGASCFPPMKFHLPQQRYSDYDIQAAFGEVTQSLDIQATAISELEATNFPITHEKMDKFERKEIAKHWVQSNQGNIYHTRLAVSSEHDRKVNVCSFQGVCFSECPSDAIWNPRSHLKKFPMILNNISKIDSSVTLIDESKKLIYTQNGIAIRYQNLILAAGSRKSVQLINRSFPNRKAELLSSPVVMFPFILQNAIDITDFNSHFVLADLLVPYFNEHGLQAMSQVYLPTSEIAGRLLAQAPKIISELLKCLPTKNLDWILRHTGVAMLFLPGTSDKISKEEVKDILNEPFKQLRIILRQQGAHIFRNPSVYFLNHDSYHSGGVYDSEQGIAHAGINSKLYSDLAKLKIKLLDSCVLPAVPPGPHSLTAAALARLEVMADY